MKELNDIIHAYDKAMLQNKQVALVTVVKVEGSSYRRPGARMLVTEDGDITGAISGGCLEGDALRKAQLAIHQQQNKLEIYDTTDENDTKIGVQLGCNGIVYLLFEPIKNQETSNPIHLLKKILQERKEAVLFTTFNPNINAFQKGTCGFLNELNMVCFDDDKSVLKKGKQVLAQKLSAETNDENRTTLYQFIPPSIQLNIVGAGNDVQPLADMAALLGWDVNVIDGRPAYATQQRFPKANKIRVSKSADILSHLNMDEQTAVVLMTHNYNYDLAVLEQVISTKCRYVGVLGPKKKLYKMFDELNQKTATIDDEKRQTIYGPVGLDIGAETSEEIALSVIAEIKAVFSNRQGLSLKKRTSDIHNRNIV